MAADDDWCPVCGRSNTWGCGHDEQQRAEARRHNASEGHLRGRCWHYDHFACEPDQCTLAGNVDSATGERIHGSGYAPMMTHRAAEQRYRDSVSVKPRVIKPSTPGYFEGDTWVDTNEKKE